MHHFLTTFLTANCDMWNNFFLYCFVTGHFLDLLLFQHSVLKRKKTLSISYSKLEAGV